MACFCEVLHGKSLRRCCIEIIKKEYCWCEIMAVNRVLQTILDSIVKIIGGKIIDFRCLIMKSAAGLAYWHYERCFFDMFECVRAVSVTGG